MGNLKRRKFANLIGRGKSRRPALLGINRARPPPLAGRSFFESPRLNHVLLPRQELCGGDLSEMSLSLPRLSALSLVRGDIDFSAIRVLGPALGTLIQELLSDR